jgi:hypothetical protein
MACKSRVLPLTGSVVSKASSKLRKRTLQTLQTSYKTMLTDGILIWVAPWLVYQDLKVVPGGIVRSCSEPLDFMK